MRIIRQAWFLPKQYKAINLFGVLLAKKDMVVTDRLLNHESIHTAQMKEMWYIPFYLWYGVEWFIKLFKYKFKPDTSYRNVGFEREAYANQYNFQYLENRKHFAWMKYLTGSQQKAR